MLQLLAPTIIVLLVFCSLTLLSLSVFVRLKFLGSIYEYFSRRRLGKREAGKRLFALGQRVVWGSIFTLSSLTIFVMLLTVLPNAIRGAAYDVSGSEYEGLMLYKNDASFEEFLDGYEKAKSAGIEKVYDYRQMLDKKITDPKAYYATRSKEWAAEGQARKEEEAAKAKGLSVSDYRIALAEEQRQAAERQLIAVVEETKRAEEKRLAEEKLRIRNNTVAESYACEKMFVNSKEEFLVLIMTGDKILALKRNASGEVSRSSSYIGDQFEVGRPENKIISFRNPKDLEGKPQNPLVSREGAAIVEDSYGFNFTPRDKTFGIVKDRMSPEQTQAEIKSGIYFWSAKYQCQNSDKSAAQNFFESLKIVL